MKKRKKRVVVDTEAMGWLTSTEKELIEAEVKLRQAWPDKKIVWSCSGKVYNLVKAIDILLAEIKRSG